MDVEISGLKCDYCDYRDDNVPFSDYKKSIDKPCPKCGNSLLTIHEYYDCLKIYKRIEIANKIIRIFRWLNPVFYWRLIFGDKRTKKLMTITYPNREV